MIAELFFQELGASCVQFKFKPVNWLRTTSPLIGLEQVFAHDLLTSEGPKLHPQNMLMSPEFLAWSFEEQISCFVFGNVGLGVQAL